MAHREDEKEDQILLLQALLKEQSQQLEETQQALRYSQTERHETSQAFAEISQKLSNSVPLTPGPNINKPKLPRPQDLAYQAALKSQAKETDEEKDPSEENNMLKIFSHLTNVLKETNKTDVNMPPKFNGELTSKLKDGLLPQSTQTDLKQLGLISISTQKYTIA
jgi:hypothetical protein